MPDTRRTCLALLPVIFLTISVTSRGATSTLGSTDAQQCFEASRLPLSIDGVSACDKAIQGGGLTRHDLAATYSNRGIIYAANGQYTRALKDHDKAVEVAPDMGEAYINRGNVYYHTRQYEKALTDYNKAIELNAAPAATSWYNKALTLIRLNRKKEARAALEQALVTAPDSQKIKRRLSDLSDM